MQLFNVRIWNLDPCPMSVDCWQNEVDHVNKHPGKPPTLYSEKWGCRDIHFLKNIDFGY